MKYKLKDIAEIIAGGTPSTKMEQYWNGEIAWITPKDLANHSGRYISRGERNITKEGLENSSTKLMPINSVLFTSRAPIGYVAIAKNQVCTNQGFKSLVCKDSICYYMYIYYWLIYNTAYIKSKANGSTFQEISTNVMKEIEIELPSIEYQKKVANILEKIDEKIELNSKINNNLQEIALNLFNKETDRLKVKIGELAKNISKGTTPTKKDMIESRDESTIKYIRVTDFDSYGINMEKLESIPNSIHLSKLKRSILFENDVLVSIAGTLGKVAVITKKLNNSNTNQAVAFIRLKSKENIGFLYFYLKTESFQEEVRKRQVHAVQPNLSLTELGNIQVPLVDGKEKETFNKLLERILHNNEENETLAQLRDILLPKLMNGEIDLDNIEI